MTLPLKRCWGWKRTLRKMFIPAIYVVIANDAERVKECRVYSDKAEAFKEFDRLRGIWGDPNVCIASRFIDPDVSLPSWIPWDIQKHDL